MLRSHFEMVNMFGENVFVPVLWVRRGVLFAHVTGVVGVVVVAAVELRGYVSVDLAVEAAVGMGLVEGLEEGVVLRLQFECFVPLVEAGSGVGLSL